MLIAWSLLSLITLVLKLHINLSPVGKKIFLITLFLYPGLESVIKYVITYNVIPYTWNKLNRIEHMLWIASLGVLITPFIQKTTKKLNKIESFIFLFAVLMMFGIFVEFLQAGMRLYLHKTAPRLFAAYYSDTMYDFFMNMIGALIISLISAKGFFEKKENAI